MYQNQNQNMNQNYMNTQTSEPQNARLQEQDWGNLVLSELKRTAREYTTAAQEATHPAIRQTFVALCQKTLQDQAELYNVLAQMQGYGNVQMATQQEVMQEVQQHTRKAEQLQSFVQQAIQPASASYAAYQQHQTPAYQVQQPAYQPYSGYSQQHHQQHQPAYSSHPTGSFSSTGYQASYPGQSFSSNTAGSSTYSQTSGSMRAQDDREDLFTEDNDTQEHFAATSAQNYASNQYSASQPETPSVSSGLGSSSQAGSGIVRGATGYRFANPMTETSGSTSGSSWTSSHQAGGSSHTNTSTSSYDSDTKYM